MTDSYKPTPWLLSPDYRRAVALLLHSATGNIDGIRQVFRETDEVNGSSRLVAAVVQVVLEVSPDLREHHAITAMRAALLKYAAAECEETK